MIRIVLPYQLRMLAHITGETTIRVEGQQTLRSALDALEARYPVLRGTIRGHATQRNRPFLRFYACQNDITQDSPDAPLPDDVVSGKEPLYIIGAIAGG
jgi:hypothetical protein